MGYPFHVWLNFNWRKGSDLSLLIFIAGQLGMGKLVKSQVRAFD